VLYPSASCSAFLQIFQCCSAISSYQVPGFRPGKIVPENVLLNYVGPQHVRAATVEAILRHTLPQALSSVSISPQSFFFYLSAVHFYIAIPWYLLWWILCSQLFTTSNNNFELWIYDFIWTELARSPVMNSLLISLPMSSNLVLNRYLPFSLCTYYCICSADIVGFF
jgi:hypothetical protein